MSFKRRSSPRSATTRGLHLSNPHYKLPHSYFIPSAVVMLCLVTIPAQIPTTYPGCQKQRHHEAAIRKMLLIDNLRAGRVWWYSLAVEWCGTMYMWYQPAGDTCFRTDVAAGCSGTLTAGYAVGVRWSGGPLDKIQMLSGVGVAGAHVVSAGRCCYTAEE
ncbi:hypothetical protein WJX77_000614 [Trebouxia sp. C0004]